MKNLITILALILVKIAFGQQSKEPCYEVSHLDFFGLEGIELTKWPESETDGLKELTRKEQMKDSSMNVNFIVPMIVYQLQEFHPNCVQPIDSNYLYKIIDVYCTIRQFDQDTFTQKPLITQIDLVRNDFLKLIKEDQNLIKMNFTIDDGPFYGIDTENEGAIVKTVETSFGKLLISSYEGKSVLTTKDKNGGVIWRKIMTGLMDITFDEINISDNYLNETSLATMVYLFAAGEQLTLYIKNDGRFMYYYHSW
jgi:hypothetical protein